jgi:transcriptional regulator with XRE-family HTH domain
MTGQKIKRLRLAQGVTQQAVADAVGVSMRTIISWEQGARVPGGDKIAKLAKALGVSADELLKAD